MDNKFLQLLPKADLERVVDYLEVDWRLRSGETFLITGATGFVGSWMLESLLYAIHRLRLRARVIVSTRQPQLIWKRYRELMVQGVIDLHAGDLISAELPSDRVSHVVHLATSAPDTRHPNHGGFFINDQIISDRIAEFCIGRGVSSLLFSSSGAVYGKQGVLTAGLLESSLASPDLTNMRSAYGLGKRCSEYIFNCLSQSSSVSVVNARLFAFVGPRIPLSAGYAAGNFIRDAAQGNDIVIEGDGTPKRSYLYAGDLAIWLWRMAFAADKFETYNVGGEVVISINQLAESVIESLKSKSKIIIKNKTDKSEINDYYPDVSKAKMKLGLGGLTSLDFSIKKTAAWYFGEKSDSI
jgi:dTDP-glucose 4,6-dehydratase